MWPQPDTLKRKAFCTSAKFLVIKNRYQKSSSFSNGRQEDTMNRNWWFPAKAKGHNSVDFSNSHTSRKDRSNILRWLTAMAAQRNLSPG
jgi:hypothetical protein